VTSDIAIVGAGPAGSWTAFNLARAGARVTIVDNSHPREKPCGGGVTGRALAMVAPALPSATLRAVAIDGALFEAPDGTRARVPLARRGPSGPASLLVVSRRDFDGALLHAAVGAGAAHVADRVIDVVRAGRGIELRTRRGTVRADWVVGADGANSLVRRRLLRPFARAQLSIATGFFAHGATSADIVIRLIDEPAGYCWSFPRPGHLAVGMCAQADGTTSAALRAETKLWIEASGVESTRLEPYSWPIPSLSASDIQREPFAGDRVLLVGDAAGLVDPITREGIYFALRSGELAAEALLGPARPEEHYVSRLRGEPLKELEKAARLKAGFFRPAFIRLVMRALSQSAAVRAVMADLIAGEQLYATLERRLLRTFEFGLAWDLVRTRLSSLE
jgi:geranylgeranyl reductase family protein